MIDATLTWFGKKAVVNHHRQVPYRLLHCDDQLSAGDRDAGIMSKSGLVSEMVDTVILICEECEDKDFFHELCWQAIDPLEETLSAVYREFGSLHGIVKHNKRLRREAKAAQ